jgi:hypothetical protein
LRITGDVEPVAQRRLRTGSIQMAVRTCWPRQMIAQGLSDVDGHEIHRWWLWLA